MQLLTFLVEQDVLYQENTNSNPPSMGWGVIEQPTVYMVH